MPSRRNDHAQPADAIALLQADHQRIKDLFAHYEATATPQPNGRWLTTSFAHWTPTHNSKKPSFILR